jgi:hypothetical protein
LAVAAVAHAQSDGLTIMRPEPNEPWLAPKYRSPPDLNKRLPQPLPPIDQPQARAAPPPAMVVPQTGAVLPNMPAISPSGPGGRETTQDRAVRCMHQSGAYGAAAGDPNAYVGGCVNQ